MSPQGQPASVRTLTFATEYWYAATIATTLKEGLGVPGEWDARGTGGPRALLPKTRQNQLHCATLPGGAIGGSVVKTWLANGWPFAMTSDGRIHTVTKSGVRKSWKPYRSVVLGKKMNQGMALRAVRKLQGIRKLADKIEKLGGTRTIYRKKK